MSREALHLSFGSPSALEAFAALMLGERPFEPSDEAKTLARLAQELAHGKGRARQLSLALEADRAIAFRALYGLVRERGVHTRASRSAPEENETKPARSLRLLLGLRHRQRAALSLRYVLGMGEPEVALVLGVSPRVAGEVVRAGLAGIARRAGSKMDVRRNLRTYGASLPQSRPIVVSPPRGEDSRSEPRSVVRLLLAPPPLGAAERAADLQQIVFGARPVYGARAAGPAPEERAQPLAPPPERRTSSGWRALAAAAAAIVILGVLAVLPQGARVSRAPLAVVPLAPRIVAPVVATPAGPVASEYRVRSGDTLWAIAATTLGNPYRWPELWRANAGKKMIGGSRFVDPDLIRPGWVLTIPVRAARGGG